MLVLDTNILIEFSDNNTKIIEIINDLKKRFSCIPAITSANYSEFYYGYLNAGIKKQQLALAFLNRYKSYNTSRNSARILAEIKYELNKEGKIIKVFDMLIASIAIDNDLVLVTMDEEFKKVKTLKVIFIAKDYKLNYFGFDK